MVQKKTPILAQKIAEMRPNFSLKTLVLLLVASLVIFSCRKRNNGDEPDPIPADADPTIAITVPTSPYSLDTIGETVTVTFAMGDNESLSTFTITEKIVSNSGVVTVAEHGILGESISNKNYTRTYDYTVPVVSYYSTIYLKGTVTDIKGKSASVTYRISVIPGAGAGGTSPYLVQQFTTDDSIWQGNAANGRVYFDFINRTNNVTVAARRDIGEISTGAFLAQLNSPNNGLADSVIVVTDTFAFNYNAATYMSMYAAFMSAPGQLRQTPTLGTGQVVLVKLNYSATTHFAAVLIKRFGSDAFGSYIVFNYKYTY